MYNQDSYTLALEKCEKLAVKNCDTAHLAGLLYLDGYGCDVNYEKVFMYFSLGKPKNAEANTYHALMLLNRQGCEQYIELGKKAYKTQKIFLQK